METRSKLRKRCSELIELKQKNFTIKLKRLSQASIEKINQQLQRESTLKVKKFGKQTIANTSIQVADPKLSNSVAEITHSDANSTDLNGPRNTRSKRKLTDGSPPPKAKKARHIVKKVDKQSINATSIQILKVKKFGKQTIANTSIQVADPKLSNSVAEITHSDANSTDLNGPRNTRSKRKLTDGSPPPKVEKARHVVKKVDEQSINATSIQIADPEPSNSLAEITHSVANPTEINETRIVKPEFVVNEVIWAKIRGFAHWPAKIKSFPSSQKVEVVWFNDYRRSVLFKTNIFKFLQNFDQFSHRFGDVVGLRAAATEGLIYYGQTYLNG